MCGGGGGAKGAGETEARLAREEEERKARIAEGSAAIDAAFGKFDDGYFDEFSKAHSDFYTPQLADQYTDASGALRSALAERGMLESSVGAAQLGDLEKAFGDETARISAQGTDAVNELRSRVERERADLISLNQAAADPQAVSTQAIGTSSALAAPQAFSDLEAVFAGFLPAATAGYLAQQNAAPSRRRAPTSATPAQTGRVLR